MATKIRRCNSSRCGRRIEIIGNLADQIVGKFVFGCGQPLRLDEEIQDLQRPKAALQLSGRHAGHRRQQRRRNSWPDDGCELQKGLVLFRQPIDSGRNDPLYRGRNSQRIPRRLGGKPAGVAIDDAAIEELAGDLFDEERNLAGMAKNMRLEGIETGRRAQEIAEQRIRRGDIEGPQPDPANIEPRQPFRGVFRPPCQQDQQRAACARATSAPR